MKKNELAKSFGLNSGRFDWHKEDIEEIENEDSIEYQAAAVIIIKDGKILCASRSNGEGICGPGGHIEEGETPENAAIREAMEEFGIIPHNLIPLGTYEGSLGLYCNSMLYFTDQYTGIPKADGEEMLNERWLSMDELLNQHLFPPFKASLHMFADFLNKFLTTSNSTDNVTSEETFDGGPGSGNFGHSGRPGKIGGSAGGGAGSSGSQKVSATGENEPCIGFASKAKLKNHSRRHGPALGTKSDDEYESKGIEFLKQKCGGDVIGYADSDGKIVRFNKKTTEYATGYPGKQLCTYMKPKASKDGTPNPKAAIEYYNRRKEESE